MSMSGGTGAFEVVFVCTGNRARSPLAAALFRRHAWGVETAVSSVGTLDVASAPALPLAVEVGRLFGVDLRDHRSRAVRSVRLSSADLVLGFEPHHAAVAVVDGGADPARAFLLGELVTLLGDHTAGDDPAARARAVIARADARRVRHRPGRGAVVVPDPVGKPDEFMHRTAALIDRLVRQLALGLFGNATERLGRPGAMG